MILATHAVTGALAGAVASESPELAFAAGFLSHFILDAIPHWDYELASAEEDKKNPLNSTIHLNRKFLADLVKIGADCVVGFGIVVFLFWGAPRGLFVGALIGAVAALVPDALQFVYFRWRHEPLISLQKFHTVFMHSKKDMKHKPVIGIISQVAFVVVVSAIITLYIHMR